jgi:cytochrome c2
MDRIVRLSEGSRVAEAVHEDEDHGDQAERLEEDEDREEGRQVSEDGQDCHEYEEAKEEWGREVDGPLATIRWALDAASCRDG